MKTIKQFILRHFYVKNTKCLSRCVELDKKTILKGKNFVGENTKIRSTTLGFQSYIGDDCDIENTIIGNFTCISHKVVVVQGQHPLRDYISIHPAFFRKDYKYTYVSNNSFENYKYLDKEKKIACIIGNDVWIGYGVLIMPGVVIGDGAVIGAGSIVTKDVEPYSIVVGAPARKINSRFGETTIKRLLDFKWWDKDEQWIKKHAQEFININDIIK